MPSLASVRFVDGCGGLELVEAVHRRPRFPRHAHPTYALGVVLWGVNRFRARAALQVAPAGTLCTVDPEEPHEVEPYGEGGFAYRCLYPPIELVRQAAAALGSRSNLTASLPPVIEDPVAAALASGVFEIDPVSDALAWEARLLELLARVLTRHASPRLAPERARAAVPSVERARDYLAANLRRNVSLAEVSTVAGLEPFKLLRAFRGTLGLPPHAWVVQERVRRAQGLLRRGWAPATVAAEVGFVDQSHLNRHFKRLLGFTPGRYRSIATRRLG